MAEIPDINALGWTELNELLLKTSDVVLLKKWLRDTVKTGKLNRALRIHGRMNYVRRDQERERIKRGQEVA